MSLKRIGPGAGASAWAAHAHAATAPTIGAHRLQDMLSRPFRRLPHGEDAVHGKVMQCLDRAAGPCNLQRPHRTIPAQTEMGALIVGGEVTAAGGDPIASRTCYRAPFGGSRTVRMR